MRDTEQSWELQADGLFLRIKPDEKHPPFNAHQFFMENPSLSGRGSALAGKIDAEETRKAKRIK